MSSPLFPDATGAPIHTEGRFAGEPDLDAPDMEPTAADLPLPEGPILLPRVVVQRAKLFGEKPPEWAVKMLALDAAGEVPSDAGGQPGNGTGSILPQVAASRQIPETDKAFTRLIARGVVHPPPYDPWLMVAAVEESDTLRTSVEIMATNLTGYGHELQPLYSTRDPETGEELQPPKEAAAERAQLELFLDACNVDLGFAEILQRVDVDIEGIGWGCIEHLRDPQGRIAALEHVRAYTVRLGRLSAPILTEVPWRDPASGELIRLRRYRRFRTFVQCVDDKVVYFKELGDPRFLNRLTGEYADKSWGPDENGNHLDATELRWFSLYSMHSSYGVPRWIGSAPDVRSNRQARELVSDWFEHAPIGAKIATVGGGNFTKKSMQKVVKQIDNMARGRLNAWTLLFLEALGGDGANDPADDTRTTPPRITFEDLAFILPEALYQGDDSHISTSGNRIAAAFQLPPVYYGKSQDHSRAAVNGARATTEEQLFVPTRAKRWHHWLNKQILPSLGVNHWRVRFKGAQTSDDLDLPLDALTKGGGASPNVLIRVANEVLGQDTPPIAEPWGDRPLSLTMALLTANMDPNKPLAELAAEAAARAEAARQLQAAALQNGDDEDGDGGGDEDDEGDGDDKDGKKKPPPPKKGRAAAVKSRDLAALRVALRALAKLEADGDDPGWVA